MTEEQKKENFKKIAERRTNEILAKIASFKNFSNSSYYSYTEEQIDKITAYILAEVKESIIPLKDNKKGKKKWRLE